MVKNQYDVHVCEYITLGGIRTVALQCFLLPCLDVGLGIVALEENGHELYGLWMPEPYWYNSVGPLPYGNIRDLDRHKWQHQIKAIKPDVIYALLNWQAVPFAHHVLMNNPGVPFIWHFKEGPFICLEKGTWRELIDLHTLSQLFQSCC